jgi:hypothetical protein
VDPDEGPVSPTAIPLFGVRPVDLSDNFAGIGRKLAKLSLSKAPTEQFDDLRDLVASTRSIGSVSKFMLKPITEADSGRAEFEERNVTVRAFLYAARWASDHDFRLVIGRERHKTHRIFMIAVVSALPDKNSECFSRLREVRESYKRFFEMYLPGPSYDFYDPPISVDIEGSLFFNFSHVQSSTGPQNLTQHIITRWEIHPLSKIRFII